VFALPVFFAVPELPGEGRPQRRGVVAAYRSLGADVARLWRTSRPTVHFLVASAVYRDGLSGVFVFGAIIASTTFGFSAGQVIQFAIAANVVAGLATVAAGWLDDRIGPKAVVVGSLVGLVVSGTAVFLLHDAGQGAFWVFGLLLCVFVGPAQSASRSLLARLSPDGHESELFGLYATTGRAAGFLASFAFSTTIAIAGAQYWGVLGIMAVLLLGLGLLLPVQVGGRDASGASGPAGRSGAGAR
jgi:UMF1 family MFS transporter